MLRYAQQEGKIRLEEFKRSLPQIGSVLRCARQESKIRYANELIDLHRHHSQWFRYAEEDLTTAETFLGHPRVPPRQACWFAQQSAEKASKSSP